MKKLSLLYDRREVWEKAVRKNYSGPLVVGEDLAIIESSRRKPCSRAADGFSLKASSHRPCINLSKRIIWEPTLR